MHVFHMKLHYLPHGLRSFEYECSNKSDANRHNAAYCKTLQSGTCYANSSSGQQPSEASGETRPTTLPHKVSDEDVSVLDVLPPPPELNGKKPQSSWNATALAFLGDGVWELYARRKLFYPPRHNAKYYRSVIEEVRAEAQSAAFKHLIETNFLTKEELEVLRWGKNASGSLPKRLNKSKPSREIYREATAIECLVGYLYTSDMNRLHKVMDHLGMLYNQS